MSPQVKSCNSIMILPNFSACCSVFPIPQVLITGAHSRRFIPVDVLHRCAPITVGDWNAEAEGSRVTVWFSAHQFDSVHIIKAVGESRGPLHKLAGTTSKLCQLQLPQFSSNFLPSISLCFHNSTTIEILIAPSSLSYEKGNIIEHLKIETSWLIVRIIIT